MPRREPVQLRRERIVALLDDDRYLRPAEIAETLGVSGETIRRDLLSLEASGRLRRVHGGAIADDVRTSEPDRASRARLNTREKEAIAARAAALVRPTDALFLDVGTTVEAVARALPPTFAGTVVTNSLLVSGILGERQEVTLYVLGGRLRTGEFTTYGDDTVAQIAGFTTDLAFIGAGGVHPEHGLSDYSTEDVAVKRAMIEHARAAYVVAGSDKLGSTALRHVCELSALTGVVTDADATDEQAAAFERAGTPLLRA